MFLKNVKQPPFFVVRLTSLSTSVFIVMVFIFIKEWTITFKRNGKNNQSGLMVTWGLSYLILESFLKLEARFSGTGFRTKNMLSLPPPHHILSDGNVRHFKALIWSKAHRLEYLKSLSHHATLWNSEGGEAGLQGDKNIEILLFLFLETSNPEYLWYDEVFVFFTKNTLPI